MELADPGRLVAELSELKPYGDVVPALPALAKRPLALLSNGTQETSRALLEAAGLGEHFAHVLTADDVERFKPSPEVYALAVRAFGAPAARVMLVTAHEWDVAGAHEHGLLTAWIARGKRPHWVLGIQADVIVDCLSDLPDAIERL